MCRAFCRVHDITAKLCPLGVKKWGACVSFLAMLWRWQPGDPRPDPFNAAGGGLDLKAVSGSIPAPAPDVLAKEREAFRHLAAATPAPDMEVQLAPLHGDSICFKSNTCQMLTVRSKR